jgi:hypothetical protein
VIVDSGFLANLLVFATIGFLVGVAVGGYADRNRGPSPRTGWRFTTRGLLLATSWLAILLTVSLYIAEHGTWLEIRRGSRKTGLDLALALLILLIIIAAAQYHDPVKSDDEGPK